MQMQQIQVQELLPGCTHQACGHPRWSSAQFAGASCSNTKEGMQHAVQHGRLPQCVPPPTCCCALCGIAMPIKAF